MSTITTTLFNMSDGLGSSGYGSSGSGSSTGSGLDSSILVDEDNHNSLRTFSIILLSLLSVALFIMIIAMFYIIGTCFYDEYFDPYSSYQQRRRMNGQSSSTYNSMFDVNKPTSIIIDGSKYYNPVTDDIYCSICLETHRKEDTCEVVQLACNHRFHKECIDTWITKNFETKNQPKCPLCNFQLEEIIVI